MISGMTEDELQQAVADYDREVEAAVTAALERRDQKLRQARDEGMKQIDIIKATGYSRETVRQALNPEIRAAARAAAAARRAGKASR